jgi:hypothetical protein
MKITSLITFLLLSMILRAQDFEWARSFGGTDNERSTYITSDAAGNLYILGYFAETADFDPGIGIVNLSSQGERDIFLQKLDAAGNFLWAKSFGGVSDDFAFSLCIDNSGNVVITGYFAGTVDFDPGIGTTSLTSAGEQDVFILKLDDSGNFLWAKSFGGPDLEYSNSISLDNSGNIFITGPFGGNSMDFDPGPGVTTLSGNGFTDVFVEKLDPAGNFLWVKAFGGIEMDVPAMLKTDLSGNVYTIGRFSGTIDFDPGSATTNLTTVGMVDVFIQKMDNDGNFLWARTFGSSITDDINGLSLDPSGNVLTTGRFGSTADFDPGPGVSNLTSEGGPDVFIQKLDTSGNFLWAKSVGSSSTDIGLAICSDAVGNVYTTGHFIGTVDFDPGTIGISSFTSQGTSDVFILKLNTSGNFLWARSFGGTAADNGNAIHADALGNVYTTGFFQATADFDPGTGVSNLTSVGSTDVFIQKLNYSTAGIDQKENLQITAYPNPSNGMVSVTFSQTGYNVELILTNLQGQLISKQTYSAQSSLDIKLPETSGVYLLNVNISGEHKIIRLIKE